MHEGGGRWVGSNKLVELKKIYKMRNACDLTVVRCAHLESDTANPVTTVALQLVNCMLDDSKYLVVGVHASFFSI